MQTYRFGAAWRALGVTFVFLSVVFPVLMATNHEAFDLEIVLTFIALALAGIWCYAYVAKYAITLTPDGFTVYRLLRRPVTIAWRNIVSMRTNEKAILFTTVDRTKMAISTYFPGYEAIETAAARRLADVVFDTPSSRPAVSDDLSPEEERTQHLVAKRWWFHMSLRNCVCAGMLVVTAFLAGLVLARLNFKGMPRAIAVPLAYLLAFVNSWGYAMSVVLVVLALLFVIMGIQEAFISRRPPPAA